MMNAATPFIDRYTKNRIYGTKIVKNRWKKLFAEFLKGIVKENPTFVLAFGIMSDLGSFHIFD